MLTVAARRAAQDQPLRQLGSHGLEGPGFLACTAGQAAKICDTVRACDCAADDSGKTVFKRML